MNYLTQADPENAEWQRHLARAHAKLGLAHRKAGETDKAIERFRFGRAIIAKLTEQHPSWTLLNRDLANFDVKIAELES